MKNKFAFLFLLVTISSIHAQNKYKLNFPKETELKYEKTSYNLEIEDKNNILYESKQDFTIRFVKDHYEWTFGERQFNIDSLEYTKRLSLPLNYLISNLTVKYKLNEFGEIKQVLNYDEIIQSIFNNTDSFFSKMPTVYQNPKVYKNLIKSSFKDSANFEHALLYDIFSYYRIYGKEISLKKTYIEDFWAMSEYISIKKVVYKWKNSNSIELNLIDDNQNVLVTKEYVFNISNKCLERFTATDSISKLEFKLIK